MVLRSMQTMLKRNIVAAAKTEVSPGEDVFDTQRLSNGTKSIVRRIVDDRQWRIGSTREETPDCAPDLIGRISIQRDRTAKPGGAGRFRLNRHAEKKYGTQSLEYVEYILNILCSFFGRGRDLQSTAVRGRKPPRRNNSSQNKGPTAKPMTKHLFRPRSLYVAILVGLSIRITLLILILYVRGARGSYTPDTSGYVGPMMSLLHGSFSLGGVAELNRPPGYPVFLLLTGLGKQSPIAWTLWQIAFSLLSIFFLYELAFVLFQSRRVAGLCAILYAIEPVSVLYSDLLFPDSIFTCLVVIFLYCIVRYFLSARLKWLLLASICIVACTYIKPVSYYLPFCFAVGLLFCPQAISVRRRVWGAICFLTVYAVFVGVWQYRNYNLTGYSGFSSVTEKQLYLYDAAGVVAKKKRVDFFAEQTTLSSGLDRQMASRPLGSTNRQMGTRLHIERTRAMSILKSNWTLFVKMYFRGVLIVTFDPNGTDLLRYLNIYPARGGLMAIVVGRGIFGAILWLAVHQPVAFWVNLCLAAWLLIYYCWAIFGIPTAYRRSPGLFWVLCLTAAYFLLAAGGPAAYGRYRDPVMPIVCIFAGAGLARLADCVDAGRARRASLHTNT